MKAKIYQLIVASTVCVFAFATVIAGNGNGNGNGNNKDKEKEKEHQKDQCSDRDNRGGCKPRRCGTGMLHLDIEAKMLNEAALSNAIACVETSYHSQGNATIQSVKLKARGLDTNSTYALWAATGGDTNFVFAADLPVDTKGAVKVTYRSTTLTNKFSCQWFKNPLPLPAELDPVYDVQSLAIGNASTQAVFTADLAAPNKLQYLIKRCFTNDTVSASMNLHATVKWVKFNLCLSGLEGGTNYFLTVNDVAVSSGTSKTNGTLRFTSLPIAPADILTVTNIGVWDSQSNTVIQTSLPFDSFTDNGGGSGGGGSGGSTNEPAPTLLR